MASTRAAMLGWVSHLPRGDWRIGLPYCVCAGLQALRWAWRCDTSATNVPCAL